jgi:hypothetical protein
MSKNTALNVRPLFVADGSKPDRVEFVANDGRVMFEVLASKDGRSIEVRGIETCMVGGVLYSSMLDVRPVVANVVEVRARPYDE